MIQSACISTSCPTCRLQEALPIETGDTRAVGRFGIIDSLLAIPIQLAKGLETNTNKPYLLPISATFWQVWPDRLSGTQEFCPLGNGSFQSRRQKLGDLDLVETAKLQHHFPNRLTWFCFDEMQWSSNHQSKVDLSMWIQSIGLEFPEDNKNPFFQNMQLQAEPSRNFSNIQIDSSLNKRHWLLLEAISFKSMKITCAVSSTIKSMKITSQQPL